MEEDRTENNGRKGGFKTMPFILAGEFCDRFTSVGLNANMITYLTQKLHLPLVQASNIITNFHGTSSFTPILGALVADSFAGRFWTISAGATIYFLGMGSLTLSAVLPRLRPPECTGHQICQQASADQLAIFYLALLFNAIGTGGIRPCVVAFGADQFDMHRKSHYHKKGAKRSWSFFDFYFFALSIASLLALTVVVYVQDYVGWGWGFGIPAIAMFVSLLAFVIGYPLYIMIEPGGSPLTRLTQVIIAAIRKRNVIVPSDSGVLYDDKELDSKISIAGKLLHTDELRFLDRAAIKIDGDMTSSGQPRIWRLSTVHRVEELKCILRMLPIWSVGIIIIASVSHNHSFAVQQARTMDRRLNHRLQIPAASMSIFSVLTTIVGIAVYDRLLVPLLRRFTGNPTGITYFQRLGIGLTTSIFANLTAAVVESKRRAVAADHGLLDKPNAVLPISVFWLIPQYSIHGLAEAFAQPAHMEFLCDQIPESMRSTGVAMFWLSAAVGNYLGTLIVTLVNECTRKNGEWLQDNLNRAKLDNYYWLVTALQVVNLVYFIACTMYYTFKLLEAESDGESRRDVPVIAGESNGSEN